MKTVALVFGLVFSNLCAAEIAIYKSTDNTGINKLERIEVIESYLATLSGSLKNMEAKLDANTIKLTTLENVVKAMKEIDIKKIQDRLGEQKAVTPPLEELEKLKADFLSLKNNDIERMRLQIQGILQNQK